ncbi:MAG: DUF1033 family protein [Pseudobutyrivibrio sp.]|nr:DUF1033 family protein [Pseudobutyrivibrio sp.]
MNEFELFTLIYFVLDSYYDSDECDDYINTVISDMGPFTFSDIGSADRSVFENFKKFIDGRKITIDNSFSLAKDYVKTITYADVTPAFEDMTEERWKEGCEEYLAQPHKGMDLKQS